MNTSTPIPANLDPRLVGQTTKYTIKIPEASVVAGIHHNTTDRSNRWVYWRIQQKNSVEMPARTVIEPLAHLAHCRSHPSAASRPSRQPKKRASARGSNA